ncbi:MAG: ribonuclease protein component [Candidatus Angelobacter sp.]|jgi:ribonuclease P protein component|nr:ribonuclease protein component [Candidatus Angelobacter sp.]
MHPGRIVVVTAFAKSVTKPNSTTMSKSQSRSKTPFSFPKASRLLKHSTFQDVYEGGRRHFSTSMTLFYILKESASADLSSHAEVGITVGRALGGAVDRNRIKRRMRDLVRHQLGPLNTTLAERYLAAEIVINPKKAALTAEHEKLRAEVERGFNVIASAKLQDASVVAPKPKRRESNS